MYTLIISDSAEKSPTRVLKKKTKIEDLGYNLSSVQVYIESFCLYSRTWLLFETPTTGNEQGMGDFQRELSRKIFPENAPLESAKIEFLTIEKCPTLGHAL